MTGQKSGVREVVELHSRCKSLHRRQHSVNVSKSSRMLSSASDFVKVFNKPVVEVPKGDAANTREIYVMHVTNRIIAYH